MVEKSFDTRHADKTSAPEIAFVINLTIAPILLHIKVNGRYCIHVQL